jgi:hypothetical protein
LTAEDLNDSVIKIFSYVTSLYPEDKLVEKLSLPQRNFYFNQIWEMEVNGGGINQYFFNSSGKYAHQTVEALKAVGAEANAKILQEAIGKFPDKTVPQDDGKRQDVLEVIEDNDDEAFEELDRKFYEYPEDLNALNIEYIKKQNFFQ